MPNLVSVVIPTYNRRAILERTLAALCRQERIPGDFEVIVVDDGSTDDTAATVRLVSLASTFCLRYIHQQNVGAGAARNRGIEAAAGEIILFLDDDILAEPRLVLEHLHAHEQRSSPSAAILGRVALAPEIPSTALNVRHAVHRWDSIQNGQELSWQHFITNNVSVKRSFLLDSGLWFDETLARFQDTEFAYRCARHGLTVYYCAGALGYHLHHLTFETFLRMSRLYGETAAVLHHQYPELQAEIADYLCFSWRNPPARVARDLIRPLLLNRLTVGGLTRWVEAAEKNHRGMPVDLACRIGSYHERRGYAEVRCQLRRRRETPHA